MKIYDTTELIKNDVTSGRKYNISHQDNCTPVIDAYILAFLDVIGCSVTQIMECLASAYLSKCYDKCKSSGIKPCTLNLHALDLLLVQTVLKMWLS